jgi:hypothetical protein
VLFRRSAQLWRIPVLVLLAPPLLPRLGDMPFALYRCLEAIHFRILHRKRDEQTHFVVFLGLDRLDFQLRGCHLWVGARLAAVPALAAPRSFHLFHLRVRRLVALGALPAVQLRLLRQTGQRRVQAVQVVVEVAGVALGQEVLVTFLPADAALVQHQGLLLGVTTKDAIRPPRWNDIVQGETHPHFQSRCCRNHHRLSSSRDRWSTQVLNVGEVLRRTSAQNGRVILVYHLFQVDVLFRFFRVRFQEL